MLDMTIIRTKVLIMTILNDTSLVLREEDKQIVASGNFIGNYTELPDLPNLADVIARLAPFPAQGVFLGLAGDGMPLLLNVFDPSSGSILIIGDAGAGKTNFLRSVARATLMSHPSPVVDFISITPDYEDWIDLETQPNCLGVWEASDPKVGDLLFDLTQSVQANTCKHPILFFIDDLSQLGRLNRDVVEMLYWLLHNGPAGRIWPIVTLNAQYAGEIPNWVMAFPTRIFGHVSNPFLGRQLAQFPGVNLNILIVGGQFCIRENGSWLRFWLPTIS